MSYPSSPEDSKFAPLDKHSKATDQIGQVYRAFGPDLSLFFKAVLVRPEPETKKLPADLQWRLFETR